MSIDLQHIRSRNPIEDVVGEKFSIRKSGSRFVGVEHDSFVVIPSTGYYFWNSKNEQGDVFDFTGRYILSYGDSWQNRDRSQFMEAVQYLAGRAGINLEKRNHPQNQAYQSERNLVQKFQSALLDTPQALAYATGERGWSTDTVKASRLGFMPYDKRELLSDTNLPDTWKRVIQKFPSGMLVYCHVYKGRLTYITGRSIEGKKHYNPPREIVGEKQPFFNHCYSENVEQVAVVEGQADAITFAEWGIPAIALCGMTTNDVLTKRLGKHKRVFITLDNTKDANAQSNELARAIGRRAFIPTLPDGIKDANDWLIQRNANVEEAKAMLNNAQSWVADEITQLPDLEGLERQDAVRVLFKEATTFDSFALAEFKAAMAEAGIKGRFFNDLLKAARTQQKQEKEETRSAEILSDDIPILSPALGFHESIAIVTVSIRERTANDKIITQPYVVTSNREMLRLDEKQIIKVNGQEVALRVMPEGSEFLMRWRHTEIQKYLSGDKVDPGDVFNVVHDLYTTYIDFRSPVESKILTLWTIGTYFYTMFPAYPYVALNGPKNSGKSTVLRVLQPLAFNMVTTSDPTGASMFRLIHHTSCTVGIDEAERYHNPRDMAMQQIRQLLNSGYKQGMPAIRLMGDDMRPKAYEVYSPKILAAIMGLEDVLASRCIPIPMRRTDRHIPSFPPDFDGSTVRHELYVLALTHFQYIYGNYFERPELHKLTNRTGELWSPLIALAAFFEEEGKIEGLLEAISEAANWDAELSQGKALSNREESVLRALEVMTRDSEHPMWIKAKDLREKVRHIMGITREQMGHAQWIGHVLNRLALTDRNRRKAYNGGQKYQFRRKEVTDMMRRYDVEPISDDSN